MIVGGQAAAAASSRTASAVASRVATVAAVEQPARTTPFLFHMILDGNKNACFYTPMLCRKLIFYVRAASFGAHRFRGTAAPGEGLGTQSLNGPPKVIKVYNVEKICVDCVITTKVRSIDRAVLHFMVALQGHAFRVFENVPLCWMLNLWNFLAWS